MIHDVIVQGAGPAGSVVARRLAASGARVALVGAATRAGWEGLSVRTRLLLAEEGIDEHAGLLEGPLARGGNWAGRGVEGREWLVERRLLCAALRADARAAGAVFHADRVLDCAWIPDPGAPAAGAWRVWLQSGQVLMGRHLIEARGRRGPQRRGLPLLAVGQPFRRAAVGRAGSLGPRPAVRGTQIFATDFGWCWFADLGRSLWVQLVSRPGSGHPTSWIRAAAAQLPALALALEDAIPAGAGVARPAQARFGLPGSELLRGAAAPGCDVALWRTGDAAFALDPLSGQGVYEALRGARLVATAVLSVLEGGAPDLAHRFVRERHEDAWHRGVEAAAGLYREVALQRAAGGGRGPFWSDTAAAYQALVPAPARLGPAIERRPVLEEGRIVERDVVVTAERPRGVWHVAGVPVVSLKRFLEAADPATVETAATALNQPPEAVASAIHWLQQTGIVARQSARSVSAGG